MCLMEITPTKIKPNKKQQMRIKNEKYRRHIWKNKY